MPDFSPIAVNQAASIRREEIADGAHCAIVDDVLTDPGALADIAVANADSFRTPGIGYPGLQLPVAQSALGDLHRLVKTRMSKLFPFHRVGLKIRAFLSMVTLQPEELWPLQRICHIDPDPDPGFGKYAAVIYLFDRPELGGTSFFRWRNQDLVWKAADTMREDSQRGMAFLRNEFATFREPPRYMTDSNEIAERVCTMPAKFNRMIFYSGDIPHSGAIERPDLLSKDFRTGRLTLNLFVSVMPRSDSRPAR